MSKHVLKKYKPFQIYIRMIEDGVENIEIPTGIFVDHKFEMSKCGLGREWVENHRGYNITGKNDNLSLLYKDLLSYCESINYKITSVGIDVIIIRKNDD